MSRHSKEAADSSSDLESPGRKTEWDALQEFSVLLTMLVLAYAFSTNRRAIRLKTVALGTRIAVRLCSFRAARGCRSARVSDGRRRGHESLLELRVCRLAVCVWRSRQAGFAIWDLSSPFRCCRLSFSSAPFSPFCTTSASCRFIIQIAAWVMTRVMGASGAESLNVAASIFMGQTEAPVTIRPFLPDLTRSELMTVMTSGMAHVSGGIMAAYIRFRHRPEASAERRDHDCAGNLADGKNAGPGNGTAEDGGTRRDERRGRRKREGRKSAGSDRARDRRWFASGAEYRAPC